MKYIINVPDKITKQDVEQMIKDYLTDSDIDTVEFNVSEFSE